MKEAVRILEERIARRESAEAAWIKWKRQLPPEVRNLSASRSSVSAAIEDDKHIGLLLARVESRVNFRKRSFHFI